MSTIKYRVIDPEEDCLIDHDDSLFKMTSNKDLSNVYEARDAAEECAMHFYVNHCGESYNWPLVFAIVDDKDIEIVSHEVELDLQPRFKATRR